jgi:hypothetical protein
MKTLYERFSQAFNALEFSNVGHLNALTEKLNSVPLTEDMKPVKQLKKEIRHTASGMAFPHTAPHH